MGIGEKIRTLRKREGWSQDELASRIGVSRQTVSKWELAEAVPDAGNIAKLCTLFGLAADELLGMAQGTADPPAVCAGPAAPIWKKKQILGAVLLAVGFLIVGVLVVLSLFIPSREWVEYTYTAEDIVMLYQPDVPETGRTVTIMKETIDLLPFLNTYTLHWLFAGGVVLIGVGIYLLCKAQKMKKTPVKRRAGDGGWLNGLFAA